MLELELIKPDYHTHRQKKNFFLLKCTLAGDHTYNPLSHLATTSITSTFVLRQRRTDCKRPLLTPEQTHDMEYWPDDGVVIRRRKNRNFQHIIQQKLNDSEKNTGIKLRYRIRRVARQTIRVAQ